MAERVSGWGRTSPATVELRHPGSAEEILSVLAGAPARGVLARGLGRAYGDPAQNSGGTVLRLDELAWVDASRLPVDGCVRAGGGASLDAILRKSVPAGFFLPVSPGTRQVTVGGAIAADVHGKNHHHDGSFGEHVEALVLATPLGLRTLHPTDELFWATVGGMGLTGVILEATVRMKPIASSRVVVDTDRAADLDGVLTLMADGDHAYDYSVAWIDCLARGGALGRSVLTRGRFAAPAELAPRVRATPLAYDPRMRLRVPPGVPGGLLGRTTVRAFNELWFRRAPVRRRDELQSIGAFFHPLDGVADWNRLYGPRGFVQYQFVVPFGAEDVLRAIVADLAGHPAPGFLAVLKRFGAASAGHLSFPMPGWTLAIDVPAATPRLGALLARLDAQVLEAGGRIYLAKDARARAEDVHAMYPRLERWRAIRDAADPDGVLTSDLARRLRLGGARRNAHTQLELVAAQT